ncbi:class I SAM-dependent methyltransferase [Actinoplanes sp. NPDC049668]|uniref:class I SAM-dependent methyltransferase n=1 Tax=unclassified Actinoplanes TaxID=2626549 RepID=UPI0033BD3C89
MSIRKFLLLPGLIRASLRSRRRSPRGWETFWSGVRRTGPGGDVLWDVGEDSELGWCLRQAERHFDRALPVVDVGCGNGRFTRLLAETFPVVVGIDVAASAIRLAEAESAGQPRVSYRVLDAADPDAMRALARELGPANVFVRGVLHITAPGKRSSVADGIAALVGGPGRVLLVETAFEGDPLGYLEYVGGGHGRIPTLVRPLVGAGIPPPRRFARPELDRTFPAGSWPRLDGGAIEMCVIDQDGQRPFLAIPGFFAALEHVGTGDRKP